MGQHYRHMSSEERNFLHKSLNEGHSTRWIAERLGRSAVTIWHEIRRNSASSLGYEAHSAACLRRARRRRGLVKLREGTHLRAHVMAHIRIGWSPQQISGRLRAG